MPFKPGQSGNPNGKSNPGKAGRPPDWLRVKCQKIVEKKKLIEFLGDVAGGEDFEQGVGDNGEVIKIPAAIRDRTKASEILLAYGFGSPKQSIEHSGSIATETEEEKKARRDSVVRRLEELKQEIKK